jgi:VanZ family protein
MPPALVSRLYQFLFFILLAMVLYLGLRPTPAIVTTRLFPRIMAVWFDHHDVFKNIFGFGVLSFSAFKAWPRARWPVIFIASLIVLLEILQLWLPHRVASVRDIIAGECGLAIACLAARNCRWRGTLPNG